MGARQPQKLLSQEDRAYGYVDYHPNYTAIVSIIGVSRLEPPCGAATLLCSYIYKMRNCQPLARRAAIEDIPDWALTVCLGMLLALWWTEVFIWTRTTNICTPPLSASSYTILLLLLLWPTVLSTVNIKHMPGHRPLVPEMPLSGRVTECPLHSSCSVGAQRTRNSNTGLGIAEPVGVLLGVLNDATEPNEKVTSFRDLVASPKMDTTTRTETPKGPSPRASTTCFWGGKVLPGAGLTKLEDGELSQGNRLFTQMPDAYLGVGEPPPKPPWEPPGMERLGTGLRMGTGDLLQWKTLPSTEGAGLTSSSEAVPPHSKTRCRYSVEPLHMSQPSSPMLLKMEAHQDAELQLGKSIRRPPLAKTRTTAGAPHQQLTEPGRDAIPAGNSGPTQVATNSLLAVQNTVQATISMASSGPCWFNCGYLSTHWPQVPPRDHSPLSDWHHQQPLLPTTWHTQRQDPSCGEAPAEAKAEAGLATQERRAAVGWKGPVCMGRRLNVTKEPPQAAQHRLTPSRGDPVCQLVPQLEEERPGRLIHPGEAGLMGPSWTKGRCRFNGHTAAKCRTGWDRAMKKHQAAQQPACNQSATQVHLEGDAQPSPQLAAAAGAAATQESVSQIGTMVARINVLGGAAEPNRVGLDLSRNHRGPVSVTPVTPSKSRGALPSATGTVYGEALAAAEWERQEALASESESMYGTPTGVATWKEREVLPCTTKLMSGATTVAATCEDWGVLSSAPRWCLGRQPSPPPRDLDPCEDWGVLSSAPTLVPGATTVAATEIPGPRNEPAAPEEGVTPVTPSQPEPPASRESPAVPHPQLHPAVYLPQPSQGNCIALVYQEVWAGPNLPAPPASAPGTRISAITSQTEEALTAAWGVTQLDAPSAEPNHRSRGSPTIMSTQDGDNVPGPLQARGGNPEPCASSPPAAVSVDGPVSQPTRAEPPLQIQDSLRHKGWTVTFPYPAGRTAMHHPANVQNEPEGGNAPTVWQPPPARVDRDPGSRMNLTSPEGEETAPASSSQPASSKVTNTMETTSPVEKPEEVYTRRLLVQAPSCAVPPLEVARVASEVHIQRPEHPTGPATPADIADSVRPGEGWSPPPFSSWYPGGPIPQGQQTEGRNHCRKSGGADNPSSLPRGELWYAAALDHAETKTL